MPAKRRLHPLQPKNHAHPLKAQALPQNFHNIFLKGALPQNKHPCPTPTLPVFPIALSPFLGAG